MAVYVIAGASSGIGQAIAKQLAKHQENSLILLGRTFQQHATQENNKNTKQIIADLSCIRGIKEAVQKIKKEVGERKVEYIIQSQGSTPNGIYKANEDNLDTLFTVQVLSKFAIPYLLAKENAFSGTIVNICEPTTQGEVDIDDIDLGRAAQDGTYGRGLRDVMKAATLSATCLNAVTLEFPKQMPQVQACCHIAPGIVAGGNAMRLWPTPLAFLGYWVLRIVSVTGLVHSADTYASVPIAYAQRKTNGLFKGTDTRVEVTGWGKDENNRIKVWKKLVNLLEK